MTIVHSEIVTIALAMATGAVLVALSMYLLQREARMRRYDENLHRAQLEIIRKSLEEQIYKINDRLVATDERWRDVNHLLLSAQKFSSPTDKSAPVVLSEFLKRAGLEGSGIQFDSKLVFVLTPFHPDYQPTYEAIASVCNSIGLKCMRGDEEHITGDILRHILGLLVQSRLVIANLDGRNPNVFYELGLAHALGKSVLIVASSPQDLPFDVKSTRIIFWQATSELKQKLRDELLKVFIATA